MKHFKICKSLLLICLCLHSVAVFAQAKINGKTFYILKSDLVNLMERSMGNGAQSIIIEAVDTNYVFSIAKFSYRKEGETILRRNAIKKKILPYDQLVEYLKASSEIDIIKDEFFLLTPFNERSYNAYRIFDFVYIKSQEDPLIFLEQF